MTKEYQSSKFAPRGNYIHAALQKYCMNGDAYIKIEDAYSICTGGRISYRTFEEDMAQQLHLGKIYREGTRLYLTKIWRYENSAASYLAAVLRDNTVRCSGVLGGFKSGDYLPWL